MILQHEALKIARQTQAKLVVLQTWLGAGAVTPRAEAAATYAPIVAEIRRWQPQARILLLADFPRGELDRDSWRKVARAKSNDRCRGALRLGRVFGNAMH